MEILQAILLGIIQGVAEFLPISSSGHLSLLQHFFGINEASITFNIVLHIGSLCAVFAVFWRDILALIKNPFQKMTALLIVATIPAVMLGYIFRSYIDIFSQGFFLAVAFAFTGVLLLIADGIKNTSKTEKEMGFLDAICIGCMQALALPPGISRSGATITGGLLSGLNRETAARFSFLLSIIAIIGAGTLEIWEVSRSINSATNITVYVIGFVVAAISGYFSIRILLGLIKRAKLKYFAYYVFILSALILLDRFVLNLFIFY